MSYVNPQSDSPVNRIDLRTLSFTTPASGPKTLDVGFQYSNSRTGDTLGQLQVKAGFPPEVVSKLQELVGLMEEHIGKKTVGDGEVSKGSVRSYPTQNAESPLGLPKGLGESE